MAADDVLRYVVAYDVPDGRRRYRLARCLHGYGRRVQCSVFEAALRRQLFDNLVSELTALTDAADRVHVNPLCAARAGKALYLGASAGEIRPGEEVVFIA